MGGRWRIPSNELYTELINYCEHSALTIDGVECIVLRSVVNGAVLVLPAAGIILDQVRSNFGSRAYLSTRSFNNSTRCDVMVAESTAVRLASADRYCGLTIRACIPGTI